MDIKSVIRAAKIMARCKQREQYLKQSEEAGRQAEFFSSIAIELEELQERRSQRCENCRMWQDNYDGYLNEFCKWRTDETPDPDDYCSAFEMMEEESNDKKSYG